MLQGGFAPEHGEDGVDHVAPHLLSTDRGISAAACATQAHCLLRHVLPSLPLSLTHPPTTHSITHSRALSLARSLSLSLALFRFLSSLSLDSPPFKCDPFDGASGGYHADAQSRVAQPACCGPYHADAGHRSRHPAARDQTRGVVVVLHSAWTK